MGRRSLKEPRSKQLNLSLTDRELRSLHHWSETAGKRPAIFARDVIFRGARIATVTTERDLFRLPIIRARLAAIASALTELARHLRGTNKPVPEHISGVLDELRAIINSEPEK